MIFSILWTLFLKLALKHDINSYVFQTTFAMSLSVIAGSFYIYRKYNLLCALSFFYFIESSLLKICLPLTFYPQYDIPSISGFESLISGGILYILSIIGVFCLLPHRILLNFKTIFKWLAFTDALMIFYKLIFEPIARDRVFVYNAYFLFNNASIDAAFISCCLPFFWELKTWRYLSIIPIAFCLISQSSSGIAGSIMAITVYWLMERKKTLWPIGGIAVIAITGFLSQGKTELLSGSGRYHVWQLAWDFFKTGVNWFHGMGLGVWQMVGPSLQINEAMQICRLKFTEPQALLHCFQSQKIDGFTWMHNDWGQVLFETGSIGLVLILLLFLWSLWRARKSPAEFTSLITFGTLAFIQMPLRHFLFALLAFSLLFSAIQAKPYETESPYKP